MGTLSNHPSGTNPAIDLLRSYRIAHARVQLIEPFENSLRENTPLTSISDAGALVEYLNQLNLKGDMVLDELKRVSSERDIFKQKLADAEKTTKDAWDEVAKLRQLKPEANVPHENISGEPGTSSLEEPQGSASPPSQSPANPKQPEPPSTLPLQPAENKDVGTESEELFSYDSELPRLESELKIREDEILELKTEVRTLKGDLAVARESTGSMAQSLEDATRELNVLRDGKDRHERDLEDQRNAFDSTIDSLKSSLHAAEQDLKALELRKDSELKVVTAEFEHRLQSTNLLVERLQAEGKDGADAVMELKQLREESAKLSSEISTLRSDRAHCDKRNETLNGIVRNLKDQLSKADTTIDTLRSEIRETSDALEAQSKIHQSGGAGQSEAPHASNDGPSILQPTDTTTASDKTSSTKKKNKKKKKPGKPSAEQIDETKGLVVESALDSRGAEMSNRDMTFSNGDNSDVKVLQEQLLSLRQDLVDKDNALERMRLKAKNVEDLQDEIESLRDDLINVGQGHVEAKDKVKDLLAERDALEERVHNLEDELAEVKAHSVSEAARVEQVHKGLTTEFEELKLKAKTLQTDTSAAEQLAAARFRDLTNLKEILQKAQPELASLRSEATDLRTANHELSDKAAELKRLETRHEQLNSEVADIKRIVIDKDSEIKNLTQKLSQETSGRVKAENGNSTMHVNLQTVEGQRREAQELYVRVTKDLARVQEDANASERRSRDLEQQVAKLQRDSEGLREETQLKTAQYASAQSLMASMRDQTAEMAMQMKEARERCESLDEELGDAHRLLSERSREGETMRKLLADVEARADARVREMKGRMESATEERDRAEDEASTASRRKARELEELKTKVREAERSLKRAEDDKEELEALRKEWKRKWEALEAITVRSTQEIDQVRHAMAELQDALDESERQARELEKQKVDLRQTSEETRHRLEKLQKSNKVCHSSNLFIFRETDFGKAMSDELRILQNAKTKALDSEAQSSRSSLEASPSRARLGSPAPKARSNSTMPFERAGGPEAGNMDYVYLKNVLLQFLEQRDKKHQMQLIPVLAMLLHFDRKDEQKWMAAITTK